MSSTNKARYDYLKSLVATSGDAVANDFTPSSAPGVIAGVPSGASIPLEKLSSKSRSFAQSTQQLTLVREWTKGDRTAGTLWYGGKILGFTVEDAIRNTKLNGRTAIPKGIFNLTLDTTGNESLKRNYVQFPGDNRQKFRSPGVFPRIGSDAGAVNLEGYGLNFAGIRIHNGTDEGWSEGCIIYSSKRNNDGTLLNDLGHCKALTKLIYDNDIKKIVVTNEWENTTSPSPQSLQPTPPPIVNNSLTPTNPINTQYTFNPDFLPKK